MTREERVAEINEIEQKCDAVRRHLEVAKDCYTRNQAITGKTHTEQAIMQLDRIKIRLEYL